MGCCCDDIFLIFSPMDDKDWSVVRFLKSDWECKRVNIHLKVYLQVDIYAITLKPRGLSRIIISIIIFDLCLFRAACFRGFLHVFSKAKRVLRLNKRLFVVLSSEGLWEFAECRPAFKMGRCWDDIFLSFSRIFGNAPHLQLFWEWCNHAFLYYVDGMMQDTNDILMSLSGNK